MTEPVAIDYLSRDYAGLRQSLLTYAQQAFPEWAPASEGDFGVALVEAFAYMGDIMSYYTDRAQMENYLSTATQRQSVLAISYLLGYVPTPGAPAKGTVTLENTGPRAITIEPRLQINTGFIEAIDGPVVFEVDDTDDATLRTVAAAAGGINGLKVINVTEGQTVSYTKIGESTGQPNQIYILPNVGVYTTTVEIFVEAPHGSWEFIYGGDNLVARKWLKKSYLLEADPEDRAFETFLTTTDGVGIRFGDGINGRVPATGTQIFASYRHGAGAAGNLTAGQVYLINSTKHPAIRVDQDAAENFVSSAMVGGADPESTDSIRYNAPRSYRTQQRAVTVRDFRDLALGVEGVSKANVIIGTFSSVIVYIADASGGAPSQALKDAVAVVLQAKALAGVSVTVASPAYIDVNFGTVALPVAIELWDQYSQTNVKAAVRTAVSTFVNTQAFGNKLTVGEIYDVIKDVEGVRYVDIPVMAISTQAQTGTATINPRRWEILKVGTLNLTATGGVV